jgi:hypothetical protein
MRSGTIHRLHISEFGKICAKYPEKAKEVMTGSIPAVPTNGILVIESTAEGANGEFYELSSRAETLHYTHVKLTVRDYRFHFYAWWQEPNYRMDSSLVEITPEQHEYFERIEQEAGCTIDLDQRAWYVATQAADFAGREERMWQEYPSTPAEAFQQSTEGHYLTKVLQVVWRSGICKVPVLDLPCTPSGTLARAMAALSGLPSPCAARTGSSTTTRPTTRTCAITCPPAGLGYVFASTSCHMTRNTSVWATTTAARRAAAGADARAELCHRAAHHRAADRHQHLRKHEGAPGTTRSLRLWGRAPARLQEEKTALPWPVHQ